MGVPAFFRWLANRYPCVMLDLLGGRSRGASSTGPRTRRWSRRRRRLRALGASRQPVYRLQRRRAPLLSSKTALPNREMNEKCSTTSGKYLDRLVAAVRPTKLVYLALDGCAPRAKMNQQRERRFCSAREAEESERALGLLLKRQGHKPSSKQRWDHNAITPGTPFMDSLASYCRTWAAKAVARQPFFESLSSDASTPGEGEHKIMDHIRRCGGEEERHAVCGFARRPTSHVASMASSRDRAASAPSGGRESVSTHTGQDADLMFLSLALHAPRVYVLRERVQTGRTKSTGPPRLQYLSAQRLRHCLVRDPGINGLCTQHLDPRNKLSRFERDDERLLDDFVLLCFFVGNDFLPQLPCLSIPDGGLDLLLALYSRVPRSLGGYLTDDGGMISASRRGGAFTPST